MKWMIASDIHGSAAYCEKLLAQFGKESADRLLLLGDLLYHGPRNALPAEYDPPKTAAMLNAYREKILAVRGNCDADVDQLVLEFPIFAEYAAIPVGNRILYAAHGHNASEQTPPPLCSGDILICGHTHVPVCRDHGEFLFLNPGSVSIPKENTPHSCMTLENGCFRWISLEDGAAFMEYVLQN